MTDATRPPEWAIDIDVKLAFQERLIGDLETLVRDFATRLDAAERELATLKASVASPMPAGGAANEPPPHY